MKDKPKIYDKIMKSRGHRWKAWIYSTRMIIR